ncbi:MAG: aldo/keto reductase, partial [Ignavibacteria bacterium]|nr:aldo/keto reductase [Ignavibacteria bacterium]
MNHKELGQTAVTVPEIGLGTWRYSSGVDPLTQGIELGAFLIDTAEHYDNEEMVGQAAKALRDRVFIATKVSPQHFSYSDTIKAADQSLKRLRREHIDLYQLHSPNITIPIEETLGALEDLVDAGKVRFIGVSNFCVAELKKAQASMKKYRIVSNQVRYSLIERSIEVELLQYCQENHVTTIAYSPLGHGIDNIRGQDPKGVL